MPKSFKAITALFLLLALIYLDCAPTTVQNLDSGEMVANSYGLFVLHPPGYPLFTWILFLVTHIPVGTVFFRAAAFTVLCSLGTLWVVYRIGVGHRTPGSSANWVAVAMMIALALTPVYWRYSILPDVFMLHLFFCALLSYLYFMRKPSPRRLWLMSIVFGLGAAHHQTILFCLPMLLHAAWETRPRRHAFLPLLSGAALTIALYLSLLLLHTDSLNSWRHLQTLADLWHHFLRSDFGTLQISGHGESHFDWDQLGSFALTLLRSNPATLVLIPFGLFYFAKRRTSRPHLLTVLICALLSIFCLIPFANIDDARITERFFLMPTLLCVILAAAVWNELSSRSRLTSVVFSFGILAIAGFSVLPHTQELNYSHDTLLEDYAQNLLRMTKDKPKSAMMVDGDTRLFALRYVQVAQGLSPQTILIPVGMAFDDAQIEKIKHLHPDFKVDADWNSGPQARSISNHIIHPNLQTYDFITSVRLNEQTMQTTFLGLGRRLRPGPPHDMVDVDSLALIKRRTPMSDPMSLVPNERKDLYSEYAFAYLKLGMLAKDPDEQLMYFHEALDIVPYCWPALANICVINEKLTKKTDTDCRRRLSELKSSTFNYY